MGQGLGILTVLSWIVYFFPSLTSYSNVIGPIVVVIFGALSIFSDILPLPGSKFPIPEKEDLDIELRNSGKIVLHLAKIARRITLVVNWILLSSPYKMFYTVTKIGSGLFSYLKLSRTINHINKKSGLKPPEPFDSKLDDDREDR